MDEIKDIFPITIGKETDDFFCMYADGRKFQWSTEEEMVDHDKLFPRNIEYENAIKIGILK